MENIGKTPLSSFIRRPRDDVKRGKPNTTFNFLTQGNIIMIFDRRVEVFDCLSEF